MFLIKYIVGVSTTFIGVMPVALSASVIFRTFFKCFFLIIILGGSYGLLVLPAVLPSIPFDNITSYAAKDSNDNSNTDSCNAEEYTITVS